MSQSGKNFNFLKKTMKKRIDYKIISEMQSEIIKRLDKENLEKEKIITEMKIDILKLKNKYKRERQSNLKFLIKKNEKISLL